MTKTVIQNALDDLQIAVERECWEDVGTVIAYLRESLTHEPQNLARELAEHVIDAARSAQGEMPSHLADLARSFLASLQSEPQVPHAGFGDPKAVGVIPFTHWSKDPLIPYTGCTCSSCEDMRRYLSMATDNTVNRK